MSGPDLSDFCKCPHCEEVVQVEEDHNGKQECDYCHESFDPELQMLTWVEFYDECKILET